jgi:hypothetical protein
MKGFIIKAGLLWSAVLGSVGCYGYRDLVDPCWPERYWSSSRQLEKMALAPQVQNGQVLDQTVWNYYFDPATATLNAMGIDHLAYIARRRPSPDPMVYLQTAQDISYDPAAPEKMSETRSKLDGERITAVQKFLEAQTAGRPVAFTVTVHDPAEVGLASGPVANEIYSNTASFTGRLRAPGGSVTGGAGAQPGGPPQGGATGGPPR